MLQRIASGSRSNGTNYGYGTWGIGSTYKTADQTKYNHMITKKMWAAQKRGDWNEYQSLQAKLV